MVAVEQDLSTQHREKNELGEFELGLLFAEGSNDPHDQRNEQGARRFFFAPKQERLHLDLSALLFAKAYTRGLFVDHLDVLLSKDADRFPATRPKVAKQAVLVAATTECELIVEQEMRSKALTRKLQQFCLSIGILCYVSMNAFRRQAAQEAKSMHSTEAAMALLDHAPTNLTTVLNYNHHGFGRRDVTSFRLGGVGLTSASIRKFFSPSNRLMTFTDLVGLQWSRNASAESSGRSLREEIDARARQLITSDPQYERIEAELHNILEQTHETLQAHGHLPHDEPYQTTAKNVVRYRALTDSATQPDLVEIRKKLEEHLILRKYERRGITQHAKDKLRKTLQEDMSGRSQQMARRYQP
ncbi:uncharacterized protein J4E84_000247 [Alternaria hordeiaustralica]|uniref:uncharacterized protein n=1 Tax=Alternaria hordeiaustralica TaxID=1187925 RepID=UPI0020C4C3D5|nr:uncharacterized protein J4E84_000247 [Alternaria hordeiaustralica]KAI4697122.1 hypothetical protein J4E84_000247 [Alternaria hordeiaustralica]